MRIPSTLKLHLVLCAPASYSTLYGGHTLNDPSEQAPILMQGSPSKPATAFADLSCRSVGADLPDIHIVQRSQAERIGEQDEKALRRQQSNEPIVGHRKVDHHMTRLHLNGRQSDRFHSMLCAAEHNICGMMRVVVRKLATFLGLLYLSLLTVADISQKWREALTTCSFATHRLRQEPWWRMSAREGLATSDGMCITRLCVLTHALFRAYGMPWWQQ